MGSALLDAVNAAYPAMGEFYASDWAAIEARNEGLFVYSGCAISASGTAGKVDMSAGVIFSTTTELNVAAVTAASTTITSLADGTNPKWVGLEIDSSGVLQFNAGTAAATPVKPALTAGRVLVAWLYVPAAATAVDALLSTANGKAKIMDARQLMTVHPARLFAYDTSITQLSNPTSLTTLLASAPSVPANSLNVGDCFSIRASGTLLLPTGGTSRALQMQLSLGGVKIIDYTTPNLTKDAASNLRQWVLDADIEMRTIGAAAAMSVGGKLLLAPSGANVNGTAQDIVSLAAGANGAGGVSGGGGASTVDTTGALTLDLKATFDGSSTGSLVRLRLFKVIKEPA